MKNRIIPVIVGPTAVGKTKYAVQIARKLNGEIVSADSMQIYRFMDIGSAKPTEEEQAAARHHLVDAVDPREPFSVAQYRHMAKECIEDIFQRDKLPVISGGTGLYVNALIYDMDFSAPPADLEPVSYTHLDVYKRQPLHFRGLHYDGRHRLCSRSDKKDYRKTQRNLIHL